jgi:hypothetical protein
MIFSLKKKKKIEWEAVSHFVGDKSQGFDSCTTSSQQLHNNPLHEGGPQCVGPTLM